MQRYQPINFDAVESITIHIWAHKRDHPTMTIEDDIVEFVEVANRTNLSTITQVVLVIPVIALREVPGALRYINQPHCICLGCHRARIGVVSYEYVLCKVEILIGVRRRWESN